MTGDPPTRAQQDPKQSQIGHDQLTDHDDRPKGLVEETGDVSERLQRIRHVLEQGESA